MVRLEWYRSLGLSELTENNVRRAFVESLLDSNRGPSFFVDWSKVRRNLESHHDSLAVIASIRGRPDPVTDLAALLRASPSIARTLPLLIAWRERRWRVLVESSDGVVSTEELDFSGKRPYTEEEALRIARFCNDSGLLGILSESLDLSSYLFGVEVGMDTNARKNRSGKFMEDHVAPLVQRARDQNPSIQLFSQRKFSDVQRLGYAVPQGLLDRKFDYALVSPERYLSIEVNYYDKEGSKPKEIVDSYIQRAHELERIGWDFVWVTDGPCWQGDPPQIQKAFAEMPAILNLEFCRRGVLTAILSGES